MLGLLVFHEIAARRGDGLLPEQPLRERLTHIPGGLAEANQQSPASDTCREP
jgi:hypothetical protein